MQNRPKAVTAIFILTVFKIAISWIFVAVSQFRELPVAPDTLLYTALVYLVIAVPTFVFIHRRNGIGVRVCLGLALLASVPAVAIMAILIDLTAIAVSFRATARDFFAST